jgi:hypothetical protein
VRKRTVRRGQDLFGAQGHALVVDDEEGAVADDRGARAGEVERGQGDLLAVDVQPHVELGPVGQREHADALAGVDLAVVEVPELGALVLGVPLHLLVAKRVHALLGAGLLLVAAGPAEGGVVAPGLERLDQGLGLHGGAVLGGREVEGVHALGEGLLVGVDDEVEAVLAAEAVAIVEEVAKVPGGVDVEEGEGRARGEERLARDVQHAGGVLAAGEQEHGALELGDDLADDVDALGLELAQMGQRLRGCGAVVMRARGLGGGRGRPRRSPRRG